MDAGVPPLDERMWSAVTVRAHAALARADAVLADKACTDAARWLDADDEEGGVRLLLAACQRRLASLKADAERRRRSAAPSIRRRA